MPKLTINFSDAARREGRAAVRLSHIADLDGKQIDDFCSREFRLGPDGVVVDAEPGFHTINAYWRDGSSTRTTKRIDEAGVFLVTIAPRNPTCTKTWYEQPASSEVFGLARQLMIPTDAWSFLLDGDPFRNASSVVVHEDPSNDAAIVRRHVGDLRGWLAYQNNGVPVIASLPLGPEPHDSGFEVAFRSACDRLPRVGFPEEQSDVAVMCDMLSGGNSENEMVYLGTFEKQEIDEVLEKFPLHYVAYALANTHGPNGSEILAGFPVSRHEDWLPDLLILRAWHHLFSGRSGAESWDIAASLFEQSVKVGVPYFRRSVKFLSEGCSLLKDSYPGLEETGRLAWRLSVRILPTETFTTVRLDITDRK